MIDLITKIFHTPLLQGKSIADVVTIPFLAGLAGSTLTAILILVVGFLLGRWADNRISGLSKRYARLDDTLFTFLGNISRYAVLTFTVLFVLNTFGIQTTSIVAVIGAAGLAVGLALQGTLSNVAAGVMIIVFRPFKLGDFVQVSSTSGTVKSINLNFIELATADNLQIIVPNAKVWGNTITNYSVYPTRRADWTFGVGYASDLSKVEGVIREVLAADSRSMSDPEPFVQVTALNDSSVDFLVRNWVARADYFAYKNDITRKMKEAFDAAGIDIPFPTRTMVAAGGVAGLGLAAGGLIAKGIPEVTQMQQALQLLIATGNGMSMTALTAAVDKAAAAAGKAGTQFTRGELATALARLVKAGKSASDAITMLPASMQLAVESDMSLTDASQTLLSNLNQFQAGAGEASRMAQQLAIASLRAKDNALGLGEGMSSVGPIAKEVGLSFASTLGLLTTLSNEGLPAATKGGVALRRVLTTVLKPSKEGAAVLTELGVALKDANGHQLSAQTILSNLVKALQGYGVHIDAVTGKVVGQQDAVGKLAHIFSTRALTAIAAIVGSADSATNSWRANTKAIQDNSESLQQYADTILSHNLAAAQKNLRTAVDNAAEAFTLNLAPALIGIENKLAGWIDALKNVNPRVVRLGIVIAGAVAAVVPLILGLGLLVRMGALVSTVMEVLGAALSFAFSPVGLIIAAVVAGLALFTEAWQRNWLNIQGVAEAAAKKINAVVAQVKDGLTLKDVTFAIGGVWAVTFASSLLSVVLRKAAITTSVGGRYLYSLGTVLVAAELLWDFVLPASVKDSITKVWHEVAADFASVDLGPFNPFKDRVAAWLEGLTAQSWEIPALTVGVGFAAFKVLAGGARLARLLGGAVGEALAGVAVPIALAAVAIAAFGAVTLTPDNWRKFQSDVQAIVNDQTLTLHVKIAKLAFSIDTDVLLQGLQNLYQGMADAARKNLPKSVGGAVGSFFQDLSDQIGKKIQQFRVIGAILSSKRAPGATDVNAAGIDMIKRHEGLPKNHPYRAYKDIGGTWTIGYGHTGKDVKPGQTVTPLEATKLLEQDLKSAASAVRDLVKVPLTQAQFNALTDLVYNIGRTQFAGSELLKLINKGNMSAAARELAHAFVKVNGQVVQGLVSRRADEAQAFVGHQRGVLLPGTSGPDKYPALLAPGEAVVPSDAVRGGAASVLAFFRRLRVPGFQAGGIPSGVSLGGVSFGSLSGFTTGIENAVTGMVNAIKQGFGVLLNLLINLVSVLGKALLGEKEWGKLSAALKDARQQLADFLNPVESAKSTISDTAELWKNRTGRMTKDALDLTAAMKDSAKSTKSALGTLLSGAWNVAKNVIGSLPGIERDKSGKPTGKLTPGTGLLGGALAAQPIASGALKGGLSAIAAGGGAVAALSGVIQSLLLNSTAFKDIMKSLTPLFQALADMVGALLKPLQPIVNIFVNILTPVLKALGAVFKAFGSVMQIVGPILFIAFKMLGIAVLALAIGIGAVWNAIASVINSLLGWLGVHLDLVNIGDLSKDMTDLANATYDNTKAQKDQKKAVQAVTAALKNVPSGFKTALRTFQSASGLSVPHMASGGIVTRPTVALIGERGPEAVVPLGAHAGGGTVNVTIVSNDPEHIWSRLRPILERENFVSAGTTITPAPAFSGGAA